MSLKSYIKLVEIEGMGAYFWKHQEVLQKLLFKATNSIKIFLKDFLKGPDPDTSSEVGGCNLKYGIFGETT